MKLIGSILEDQYRMELKKGSDYLLREREDPWLLDFLQRNVGDIKTAYYLSGYKLPDFHTCHLLINGSAIYHLEVSNGFVQSFEKMSISEYKGNLKKKDHVKLLVALDLVSSADAN